MNSAILFGFAIWLVSFLILYWISKIANHIENIDYNLSSIKDHLEEWHPPGEDEDYREDYYPDKSISKKHSSSRLKTITKNSIDKYKSVLDRLSKK